MAESVARVELAAAGLPAPVSQFVVVTAGRRYFLDFAWEEVKVGLEIDGYSVHSSPEAFRADRVRQNCLSELDWTLLRVTAWDALNRPEPMVSLVARELSRRGLHIG